MKTDDYGFAAQTLSQEERNQLVTYGDLVDVLQIVTQEYFQSEEKVYDAQKECYEKVMDATIGRINEDRYKQIRFEKFIIGILCEVCHLSRPAVEQEYERYCKEFDRVNGKEDVNGR